jgi:hypothetical protein
MGSENWQPPREQIRVRMRGTRLQFAAIVESLRFPGFGLNINVNFEDFRTAEKVIGELSATRIRIEREHNEEVIFYGEYYAKLEAILLPSNDTLLVIRSVTQ